MTPFTIQSDRFTGVNNDRLDLHVILPDRIYLQGDHMKTQNA